MTLRIIAKPWRSMLPLGMLGVSTAIWHLDLRQTLSVDDLVFALDHIVLEKQKRSQRVDLVRLEAPLSTERHPAVDVIPYHRRERRAHRHQARRLNAHIHPRHPPRRSRRTFGDDQRRRFATFAVSAVALDAPLLDEKIPAFLRGAE